MKKHFLLAGIVFSLGIPSSINAQTQPATGSGTVLIEKVEAKPGELKIAYEKYKLSNGLTLIIH